MLLALTACTGEETTLKVVTRGNVRALIAVSQSGGMDAQISGTLALNDVGCLGVEQDAPAGEDAVRVVVWPVGTTLVDEGTLRTPDGTHVAIGDRLVGGGGESTRIPASTSGDPTECLTGDQRVFVMWTF